MKNICSTLLLWFIVGCLCSTYAIEPNMKYGKPSKEEVAMEIYENDTTASAVYLIKEGTSYFTYKGKFQLTTEYWVRVKILKSEGMEYADVSIPYYAPDERDKEQDIILDLKGSSYNWEKGKIVKSSLKKNLVSDERISSFYKVRKFSLPNVRKGTVIEYSYTITSDYFSHIENWMMQEEIPVVYNRYMVTIPNVLIFNIEYGGKNLIQVERESSVINAVSTVESGPSKVASNFRIPAEQYIFTAHELPALRQDEPFCWCPEDYRIQLSFDLQGTNFPGEGYKPYSKNWADVDKVLLDSEHQGFGRWLRLTTPFVVESQNAIEKLKQEYGETPPFEEKVKAAFELLKSQLAWNGNYGFYCDNIDKVVKQKSGTNADLNFIFISILKGFGLKAYPVALSRRSLGKLPVSFPTFQKFNSFVVAVYNPEKNDFIYLDSSMPLLTFNVLPSELAVDKGRLLAMNVPEEKRWVNLMQISNNLLAIRVQASILDGKLKGHRQVTMLGQYGLEYRRKKQRGEMLPCLTGEDFVFSNVQVTEPENHFGGALQEEADFEKILEQAGDMLYVNPMIFKQLVESPFVQTKRVLPVEFDYLYQVNLTCELELPEGYQVEEMPQGSKVKTEDNQLLFNYWISREDRTVYLKYEFQVKAHKLPAEYYAQLQEIWNRAVEKNGALIVLKKQLQPEIVK